MSDPQQVLRDFEKNLRNIIVEDWRTRQAVMVVAEAMRRALKVQDE